MERLTKEFTSCEYCEDVDCTGYKNSCMHRKVYDKLAHYEDLEEAGRLIELPCKVGDTVHFLTQDGRILDTTLDDLNTVYRFKDLIGKVFYLTKAEAEAKLAELKGGANDD